MRQIRDRSAEPRIVIRPWVLHSRLLPVVVAVVLASGMPGALGRASVAGAGEDLRIRKNVKDLTADERRTFVRAVLTLKDVPSPWNSSISYYDQFVRWHRNAFACDVNAAHMTAAFGPWHRQLLLLFEEALRDVSGEDVTIPYWDWTDPESTTAAFSRELLGGEGDPDKNYAVTTGPFRAGNWTLAVQDPRSVTQDRRPYLVRRFGTPITPSLPTKSNVQFALRRPRYDVPPFDATSDPQRSFRNYLEGWRRVTGEMCDGGWMDPVHPPIDPHRMHNAVHLWVGGIWSSYQGTMTMNSSNNDPAFWLHHANVDRLWHLWEIRHGFEYVPRSGAPEGNNLGDTMWPYRDIGIDVRIVDLLHIDELGYTYA